MSDSTAPYRAGFATAGGLLLSACLLVAAADVAQAGGGPGAALAIMGTWMAVALPVAILAGLSLGAANATWGEGCVRRMFARVRHDRDLGHRVFAIAVVTITIACILAFLIGRLAVGLVDDVQREHGAVLLGIVVVGLVPAVLGFGLALTRAVRRMRRLAMLGALAPAFVILGGAAVAVLGTVAGWVLVMRPDVHSLDLIMLWAPGLLPAVAIVLALLAFGPMDRVRVSIPRRATLVIAASALMLCSGVIGLVRHPSAVARRAVEERGWISGAIVTRLRTSLDRDGDGYSSFFGGPDCDDGNAAVHPGARELPGNGIDDNCFGGDAALPMVHPHQSPAPPPKQPLNVLVLFVDTLRADRLGSFGYRRDGRSLTPRLDQYAGDSVAFRNAYAQAPATLLSAPAFLGSRYPSQLAVHSRFTDFPTILDENELLFEVLHEAGYYTVGISSHFYFCDHVRYPEICSDFPRRMRSNVLQGADEWDNAGAVDIGPSNRDTAGPRIVAKAVAKLAELAGRKQKFAMLVHLFEPHSTYMEHEGFAVTMRGEPGLAQKYDYEIAYEDTLLGQLFDALDTNGLSKNTLVILISDHGEAFGAHAVAGERMFFHGQTLYRELLHVPLIFHVPGKQPSVRDDVAELVDLAPTVCDLVGVRIPDAWIGRSLRAAIDGGVLEPKAAYAELVPAPWWNHEAKSMITADGNLHVIYRVSERTWELYDLVADPGERKNLMSTHPRARELQKDLLQWIDGVLIPGGGSCIGCARR